MHLKTLLLPATPLRFPCPGRDRWATWSTSLRLRSSMASFMLDHSTASSTPSTPMAALRRLLCQPLWSGATGNDITSSPAVANGIVYIGSADHKLYAFPAKGCGISSCSPLWTGTTGSGILESSPLVVNGVVYVGSFDKKLYAFAATGCGHSNVQSALDRLHRWPDHIFAGICQWCGLHWISRRKTLCLHRRRMRS